MTLAEKMEDIRGKLERKEIDSSMAIALSDAAIAEHRGGNVSAPIPAQPEPAPGPPLELDIGIRLLSLARLFVDALMDARFETLSRRNGKAG